MHVRVITPPPDVITVPDAKKFLRVDHGDDNVLIGSLIKAATAWLDGPSGWLGRALGKQRLEATAAGVCGWNFRLPCPPVIGNVEIKYLDRNDAEQTIDQANYRVVDGRVWFGADYNFPQLADAIDAVRIRYDAGYDGVAVAENGTGPVPEPILLAIKMHVQMHYDPVLAEQSDAYRRAIDALLSPFRVFSI